MRQNRMERAVSDSIDLCRVNCEERAMVVFDEIGKPCPKQLSPAILHVGLGLLYGYSVRPYLRGIYSLYIFLRKTNIPGTEYY